MIKVLLIGGSGFIGTGLKSITEDIKEFKIFNIDKKDYDLSSRDNFDKIKQKIDNINPNFVIILAAIKRQDGDSINIREYNNRISYNISELVSNLDSKVIYLSSCAVYGEKNNQENYTELSDINPTSEYGEHKIFSEELYKTKVKQSKLLILRPPLIYDLRQNVGYHPGGFISEAITNRKIYLWGNGEEKREFIFLKDAVKIIFLFIKKFNPGIYNLVSATSFSYREIAELIKIKTTCEIIERNRSGQLVNHTYNNNKLRKLFDGLHFDSPLDLINNYFKMYKSYK